MAQPLVAPIVPTPDVAVEGVTRGLALFAAGRRAEQERELAHQKMMQDAALQQEEFGLKREALAQDYRYKNQVLEETKRVNNSRIGALDALRDQRKKIGDTAFEQRKLWNETVLGVKQDAADQLQKSGLLDADFQTKDPVGYAYQARKFITEYENAPVDAGIKSIIAGLKEKTSKFVVNLPNNTDWHQDVDTKTGKVAGPTYGKALPGGSTPWPVLDVLNTIQSGDPATVEKMYQKLDAAGYTKNTNQMRNIQVPTTIEERFKRLFDLGPIGTKTVEQPDYRSEFGDVIKSWLIGSRGLDLKDKGQSRVPAMLPPTYGASRGVLGEVLAAPQADETSTEDSYPAAGPAAATPETMNAPLMPSNAPVQDQVVQQARLAIQHGADPAAVADRLARNYGINLNALTRPDVPASPPSDAFLPRVMPA